MWDLAILEKTGMGHSLSPIGTLGLLGGFSGICLGACFFPQGGAHGVLHRNCVQKRQDAADWETRKPKILDIFSLTKHKPQHFGEMVASPQNASQDPVSTNGGKPGSQHFCFFLHGGLGLAGHCPCGIWLYLKNLGWGTHFPL